MGWTMDHYQFCAIVLIFMTLLSGISASAYTSDCPIKFEFQNYTIITSQCKGPSYPPRRCCKAFKEFACPFAKYINDLSNNCAATMFSYINLYGKYPPGLFASACRLDGKSGLKCPARRS